MPRTDALPAYRKLVADILEVAREEGATLRYWAPWNEPNHPYSSSPQRAAPCGAAQPSISAGPYVEVASALRRALRKAPGDQRYVLGEVAVMVRRLSITTTVNEFLDALPAEAAVRRARVDAAHLHRRRGRARRRRRAAEGQGLRRHADLDDRDRRRRAAHRHARAPAAGPPSCAAAAASTGS